jgi:L-alanine-DL-glutamate epimerase-like enolase superfamily enzyme
MALTIKVDYFRLPLKRKFAISREERHWQGTLIVSLSDGTHTGYGEATENIYYGISYERMREALLSLEGWLNSYTLEDPVQFWQEASLRLQHLSFAQCALDEAAWDLFGKQKQLPLWKLWGLNPASAPISNYTIGIDNLPTMLLKMQEFPWPIYKVKLGTDHDMEIMRVLRQHNAQAVFRVDANCAWTAQQTISYAKELQQLGVEFIEQPLPAHETEAMREVFAGSALPVIADESCITEADVQSCAEYFHGINIKLTKCGGPTPAKRMIKEARNLGMKVMMGCMTESTVGISAIAHLAPLLDYVDMDGPLLISKDIATGVKVQANGIVYTDTPGAGVVLTASP